MSNPNDRRDVTGWLPNTLGPIDVEVDGEKVAVPRRQTFNFVGATVEDEPDFDRTKITFGVGAVTDPYPASLSSLAGVTPPDSDILMSIAGKFVPRYAKPPGLPTLPIPLNAEAIPGAPRNAKEAFERLPQYNPTRIYVASYGSTSNPGTNMNAPTTLHYALHTSTLGSHIVCLDDLGCSTAPLDPTAPVGSVLLTEFRDTDASQAGGYLPKMIDANGQNITFRGAATAGVNLSTLTWVNDLTLTNCWSATLPLVGTSTFSRVLRTDKLDDEGLYWPFRSYTSAALLNAASASNGYFYDSAAKKLWLRIEEGSSVEVFKANLLGLFIGATGFCRVNVLASALCLVGIRFEGVELATGDHAPATGLPRLYVHQCQVLWSHNKGFDPAAVGEFVASDSLFYSSRFDNMNFFAPSAIAKGFGQLVRVRSLRAGDLRSFPIDQTLQGVSCHGGSDAVYFGCEFRENNGQQLADTNISGSHDTTWAVDCTFIGGGPGGVFDGVFANVVIGSVATNGSRTAWFDNCRSYNPNTQGHLQIHGTGSLGIVRVFGTTFASPTIDSGASAPSAYIPGVF